MDLGVLFDKLNSTSHLQYVSNQELEVLQL